MNTINRAQEIKDLLLLAMKNGKNHPTDQLEARLLQESEQYKAQMALYEKGLALKPEKKAPPTRYSFV